MTNIQSNTIYYHYEIVRRLANMRTHVLTFINGKVLLF